ncbi:hypothetical protein V1527DRAFT_468809 [Lipomyces starkeyi]
MTAVPVVFPTSFNQLCRWHIEQNILKNCRKHFDSIAVFDELMKCVKRIASSMDIAEQEKDLAELKDKFPGAAVDYFFNQCG